MVSAQLPSEPPGSHKGVQGEQQMDCLPIHRAGAHEKLLFLGLSQSKVNQRAQDVCPRMVQ